MLHAYITYYYIGPNKILHVVVLRALALQPASSKQVVWVVGLVFHHFFSQLASVHAGTVLGGSTKHMLVHEHLLHVRT